MPPQSTCSIDGCERPRKLRVWCKMHYARWFRHGDPLHVEKIYGRSPVERFWSQVDRSGGDDACWPWTGGLSNGYGRVANTPAHRFAYEIQVGPIPPGLHIDHLCRNRACQNARHLEPVTQAENIRRGEGAAKNRNKTHCPRGHPYSGDNLYRVPSTGRRVCRACIRVNQRASRVEGVSP